MECCAVTSRTWPYKAGILVCVQGDQMFKQPLVISQYFTVLAPTCYDTIWALKYLWLVFFKDNKG